MLDISLVRLVLELDKLLLEIESLIVLKTS